MKFARIPSFDACSKKKLLVVMVSAARKGNNTAKGRTHMELPEGIPASVSKEIADYCTRTSFSPDHLDYEPLVVHRGKQQLHLALLGWKTPTSSSGEQYAERAKLGHAVYTIAKKYKVKDIALCVLPQVFLTSEDSRAFLEGVELSAYRFKRYTEEKSSDFHLTQIGLFGFVAEESYLSREDVKTVSVVAGGALLARDLVNTTANDCNPDMMVEFGRTLAKEVGLKCKVYDKPALKKLGANAILAVGQGSDKGSYLLRLEHKPAGTPKGAPVIGLIGKGVTFDSGGLSIKTQMMELMKFDMGGAAAVLGTMQAVAQLNLPLEVRAYIPLVENMINGSATKPGDVVKTLSGKTVEILNTDAEGRLIMADALTLAEQEGADVILDVATLTGAVIVALGPSYAGLFTDDDDIAERFQTISDATDEKLWRLPLPPSYKNLIKSKIADVKNVGGRWGGAITAALFLQEFVKTKSWAHLDIAGVVWEESGESYLPFGGTGFGVRTLIRFIESYAQH